MKLKRIIAGMAAAVMAFSTMSIGASAYNGPYYGFDVNGDNNSQTIGSNVAPYKYFYVHTAGQLSVKGYCQHIGQGTPLQIKGQVYDPTIYTGMGYGAWGYAVTQNVYYVGNIQSEPGVYPNAFLNASARVQVAINGTSPSYYADGTIAAY